MPIIFCDYDPDYKSWQTKWEQDPIEGRSKYHGAAQRSLGLSDM